MSQRQQQALVIALVGAECSGKSTLANALQLALAQAGHDVVVVPEYLREFCARTGRTPTPAEQQAIALQQTERIDLAMRRHAMVIADTTALVTAAYSNCIFHDSTLDTMALAAQQRYGLTLLCGLDLPWQADAHQRSGAQTRAPIDAWLRAAMERAGVAYSVLYGSPEHRLQAALAAIARAGTGAAPESDSAPWRWKCRHCSEDDWASSADLRRLPSQRQEKLRQR